MLRLHLPYHLRNLAALPAGELQLDLPTPVTLAAIIDELERRYPPLAGTLRDHDANKRRPMIRFYAQNEDLSHLPLDAPLPGPVATGKEPLTILGAIAGG